jgi:hypothetical protein
MLKKMTLLAISVGALVAVAAPAMAQAQQLYELNGKQHVALVGSSDPTKAPKITATSTNLVTTTPLGSLTCTKVTIHGLVTKNTANEVEISNNVVTVEGCNHEITPATVGSITIVKSETLGVAHDATFVVDHGCHFTGDIPFDYAHDTDVLTVTGSNQLTGTPSSPCGTGSMTGSFTLETSDGTTVFME